MAGTKAEETAQKHVMLVRKNIDQYFPDFSKLRGTHGVPTTHSMETLPSHKRPPEWLKDSHLDGDPKTWPEHGDYFKNGWNYAIEKHLLVIHLNSPTRWWQARTEFIAAGSNIANGLPDEQKLFGSLSILCRTSKMGCYSWNLPAGPPGHGGCCPGSVAGYRMWRDAKKGVLIEQSTDSEAMAGVKIALAKSSASLKDKLPMSAEEARARWICNGCYAMKGNYGNPSQIFGMHLRKLWRDWAMRKGEFVDVMCEAILIARKASMQQPVPRNKLEMLDMTHPDYFRIHDAGDFDSPEYFEAWLKIVEKLPYIHFWAPTRAWADPGDRSRPSMLDTIIKHAKSLPKNLSLRPSGLFFDGPYPEIPGLTMGSSAVNVQIQERNGALVPHVDSTSNSAWVCPAYLPSVLGGGALPDIDKKAAQAAMMASWSPERRQKALARKTKVAAAKASRKAAEREGRASNPVELNQSFAMYPNMDYARNDPMHVFYEALVDAQGKFILDEHGRPVKATKASIKKYGTSKTAVSQGFQAAGACNVAMDHNGKQECRVCWNTSDHKQDPEAKRLPVVYGKH